MCVLIIVAVAVSALHAEVTLLPGIDMSATTFRVGDWCRYIVIDEAEGIVDSTDLYVAVVGKEGTGADTAWWVEFENRPHGAPDADRDLAKLLISNDIRNFQAGDSLYHYVKIMYVKRGLEPVKPGEPSDLRQLSFASPTAEAGWRQLPGDTLDTPQGPVFCQNKQLKVEDAREIPRGRVTLVQRSTDHFRVWTSDEIPVFSMVRCVIDRTRETKTVPKVAGIPEPGPRASRTTSVLVGYGNDATPIVQH